MLGLPKDSDEGRHIRGLVRAPTGFSIYEIDYSQIELRTMAELSQDKGLLSAYRKGEDIHAQTGEKVFGVPKAKQDDAKHRKPAKIGNFGVLMGLEEKGLTEQIHKAGNLAWSANCGGCKSWRAPHERDCDSVKFFREFFKFYTGVKQFQLDRRAHAEKTGFAYGMWDAKWFLPGVFSPHDEVQQATLRQSHALPIQEGAQRLIKQAMSKVWTEDLPWAIKQREHVEPILQIHDSMLFVVANDFVKPWHLRVKRTMENIVKWTIPIIAEGKSGPSWLELEKL